MAVETEATLRQRAIRLALLIVVWDVLEGAIAITAGIVAGSIALIGFGIDSTIEVFAAVVVLLHLRGSRFAGARWALRAIAVTFWLLAAYISVEAVGELVAGADAEASPVGIALNVAALVVMVPVAIAQTRTGRQLANQVVIAQAKETWLSNALSVNVLIGLGLNAAFGWAWADPLVALVVAGFAVYAGVDGWRESSDYASDP